MSLQECNLLDLTGIKESGVDGLLICVVQKSDIRHRLIFVFNHYLVLPCDELLLLLLYHLGICLVPLQRISLLLDHLSGLGLLRDQVPDLREVVRKLLVICPPLLGLNMRHHRRLGEHVLGLKAVAVLSAELPHQVFLLLVELLVHLKVLLLLKFQNVLHDVGDVAGLRDVRFTRIQVSLVELSLVMLEVNFVFSLLSKNPQVLLLSSQDYVRL